MSHRDSRGSTPSVSLLKELARKHKRASGSSHRSSLDFVAQQHGFRDWHDRLKATVAVQDQNTVPVRQSAPEDTGPEDTGREDIPGTPAFVARRQLESLLAQRRSGSKSLVSVAQLPIAASRVTQDFHRIRIGGRIWKLTRRRESLYVVLEPTSPRTYDGGAAYVGDCTRVTYLPNGSLHRRGGEGWHIVKYWDEVQIPMTDMGLEVIAEVAYQFGLNLDAVMIESRKSFFTCPAFTSLSAGVAQLRRPPRHVDERWRQNPYLGDWFAVAKGAPIDVGLQYWFE